MIGKFGQQPAPPRIGETLEVAMWTDGRESPEQMERFKSAATRLIVEQCHEHRLVAGPVRLIEKRPGDDRVPLVPDHIQGPNVRLLIAEADVVSRAPDLSPRSFLGDLDPGDLARLRIVTRRAAGRRALTDEECDRIIERHGPAAAVATIRSDVDAGTIH